MKVVIIFFYLALATFAGWVVVQISVATIESRKAPSKPYVAFKLITLEDGTKCAVPSDGSKKSISCDWK